MAEVRVNILPEGSSISAPPRFDRENFIYWQRRMKTFIRATEYGLWDVFQFGNHIPTEVINGQTISKCQSKFNTEDEQLVVLNDKAIHILACALPDEELIQVAHLETTKEMWEALEIAYGGSIEEASSEGDCSDSDENDGICLVAEGEATDSDSDNEVYDSEPTYDELLSEYNAMHAEFVKLAKELVKAKKKIMSLEEKLNETPIATCVKCIESEQKCTELERTLIELKDTSGVKNDPDFKRKEKRKRNDKSSSYSSFPAHCYYCNRADHSIHNCYFKRNESHGTFKWVPKGTYVPKAKTNRSGPERQRVPRYLPSFIYFQDMSKNGQIDRRKGKVPKRGNQKVNLMKATRQPIPQTSKIIHKRNRWRQHMEWTSMSYHIGAAQKKARASMINYQRVPFCYQKRRKRNWVR